jgi:tyrosine-protein kinase Etk/Wzc
MSELIDTDSREASSDKGFFWLFMSFIIKWRRLLVVNTILAAALTLGIMLFLPNWYAATTTILPPEKDTGLSFSGSMLPSGLGALLSGGGMSLPGLATPSDLYASILKSRIVSMAVIEKNNLKQAYGADLEEFALRELQGRTSITVQPEGIIALSYEDTNPVRAAAVANSYVEELNRVNQENLTSKAHAMREFVEQRLSETVKDLADAEEAYKNFQEAHFAVSLDDQVKAIINAIADLRGQLVLAEIEMGVMKKSLAPSNVRYKEQQYKIEQIKDQLNKLEKGDTTQTGSSFMNMPVKDTPELALQLARLTRDLKIQETIFELLKQQYEQAKIQEVQDTPTIQVLDRADVPRVKSRPKRVTMAAMGGMVSFGFTLMFVLGLEFVRREKTNNSAIYQRMHGITKMLNDDYDWVRGIFSRKRNNVG